MEIRAVSTVSSGEKHLQPILLEKWPVCRGLRSLERK